jgi:hypothetical protein
MSSICRYNTDAIRMQYYSRQVLIATVIAGYQDNVTITCLVVSWKCVDRRRIHEFP